MATTVGSHSISTFATPVNGGPLDANVVRGNDNTIKTAYVAHDADTGIHVQSSTLAARPAAGTAGRKWITEDSGVYTLWFDDGTNWHPVSSENINLTVLATENLAKGDVVKVVGWNNGQDLPEVAKVASASDVAFAIMTAAVTNGAMGYATNTGIVQDLNTNGFNAGDILYPNASGGFTATKPTSGNYQVAAYVLRKNTNNGVLFVEFSGPRIVEASANTASTVVQRDASGNFSAGTITAGALTSTGLVTFASLKGTGATTVTDILNDGTMATASATTLATSSSIKTYVDTKVATVDTLAEVLANGNTTGTNDIIVNAGQKIRTPLVAAQDGTSAITIANTTGALTLNTALADSNLATISTAGKVANSATTATSANTASAIVARDASGNFTAGTITAALTGNASTATALQTARTINGTSFDGTANITVTAAAGTLTGTTLASNVVSSSLTSVGTLANLTVTNPISGSVTGSSGSTTGNAATATALQTARNINGVSFNGTADITVTAAAGTLTGNTLASGVTASSLTSVGTLTSLTVSGLTTVTNANILLSNAYYLTSRNAANNASISMIGRNTSDQVVIDPDGYGVRMGASGGLTLSGNGNLAVDTNTLYVDAANNRVGVGTTSPGYPLDVVGFGRFSSGAIGSGGLTFYGDASSASGMLLTTSGNLGLGVTPAAWDTSIFRTMQIGSGVGSVSLSGRVDGAKDMLLGSNIYYASGAFRYIANGTATLYRTDGANHAWSSSPSGNAGDAVGSPTALMKLDASGNLGLGATAPSGSYKLDVRGTGYFEASSNPTNSVVALFTNQTTSSNNGARIALDAYNIGTIALGVPTGSASMAFYTNGYNECGRFTAGGYFKASNTGTYANSTGTFHELRTDASDPLYVYNTHATTPNGIFINYTVGAPDNNTQYFLLCNDSATARCYIWSDGDLANHDGVYGTISDERLKQDIVDAGSQWDDLKAVRFRKYRMKTDVEANPDAPFMLGVVAQEIEQVSPGLVDEHPDTDANGNDLGTTTKTVKSSILLMKAAVALQEAMARIEALEARLDALGGTPNLQV